jgi:hypothetical protein
VKTCTKCGEEKPEELFGRHALGKDGLRPACKECHNAAGRLWKAQNAEKIADAHAAYRAANRDKRAVASKVFRQEKRNAINEYRRNRRRSKRAIENAAKRRYAARNPRKVGELKARYYQKYAELIRDKTNAKTRDLDDSYVAYVLTKKKSGHGLSKSIIELKREQICLHRLTRQLKQAIKEQEPQ